MATGKSTAAGMFKRLGAEVVDADVLSHRLISRGGKCFRTVVKNFGTGILTRGRIDRQKLGRIVFRDERQLRKLTRIIHPEVKMEIVRTVEQNRKKKGILILEIPLLFESGYARHTDVNIVVRCGRGRQIPRAVKKFRISKRECLRRIASQMPLREKIRLADIVIDNNAAPADTRRQVKEIWTKFQRLSKIKNK